MKKPTRRRVKSACLTCKARKVKCDETKPVCSRCKTTGRTCDEYGVWGGGGNSYVDKYCKTSNKAQVCMSPAPVLRSKIRRDESDCIQWLHGEIIHGSSTFIDRSLWTDIFMPAAWSVPVVTHAVVALGAALRGVSSRRYGPSNDQQDLTLRQYNKAIRLLRPLLVDQDNSSSTTILTTCLLFTFLEYLRKQYKAAALHLHNGLNLLMDIHFHETDLFNGVLIIRPTSYKRSIHRAIFRGFASLHVQALLFGSHLPDVPLVLQTTDEEMPSPTFLSIEEARDSLEKLLRGILIVKQRVEAARALPTDVSFSLIESREMGLCRLRRWRATYDASLLLLPRDQMRTRLTYTHLLNYHAMANIVCTCLLSTSELVYGEHTKIFLGIIRRSVELLDRRVLLQGTASTHGPAMDMGWIPPLYYTALKCRVARIRLHAIKLLRSLSQKGGVWDSVLAANVAENIGLLEGSYEEEMGKSHFALDEVPDLPDLDDRVSLPDSNLFHEVQIELSEASNITLICKRRRGFLDLRCHFDGEQWHTLDSTT